MVDVTRPLDSFSSVGAGLTAVVAVPVGPTYEDIVLETDAAIADLTEVRLILNAEPIVAVSGQVLVDFETFLHGAPGTNMVPISLRDIAMDSFAGEENTALVTGPGDQLTLEVDVAGGSALTFLRGFAETSRARPVREVLPRLQRFSWVPGATGKQQLSSLTRGPVYRRMMLGGDTGAHDSIKIDRDQRTLFEVTTARNDELNRRAGKTALAGTREMYDFVRLGYNERALDTRSQSFVVEANVTVSGNLPVYVQSVEPDGTAWPSRQMNAQAQRGRNRNGNGNGPRGRVRGR